MNSVERGDTNGILETKPKVVKKSLHSPALELFLNKAEQNLLSILPGKAEQFNLTREEYLTMHNLQGGRNVIIKPAGKGSAVVMI